MGISHTKDIPLMLMLADTDTINAIVAVIDNYEQGPRRKGYGRVIVAESLQK